MAKAVKKTEEKVSHTYHPQEIESKWQAKWLKDKTYQPDLATAKKPYYNLHMFPYPSAEGLHVGNVYAFTGADIHGRFNRMQGYSVFQPFGLDGFGIHSENYALKIGSHPMGQAKVSEERFYKQVESLGSGYDWAHLLETYDPDYYRWTQWIFVELFKSGLAYREKVEVNWCPSCKTVLADEQVIDGKCERCGSLVEKKLLEQWMFRITEYAEELLEGLDRIDWTEKVKIAQRNWIGKSEGAKIEFGVENSALRISVFTTRPDTLYGATFLVVSPEHPLVTSLLQRAEGKEQRAIKEYVEASATKTEQDRVAEGREKTGVFSGAYALNPITNQQIPIWIADYVLMSYGTGAIMAVPAHDERDFEFAKKYDLPIVQVVAPETGLKRNDEVLVQGGCGVVFDPATQRYAVATHPDGVLRLFSGGVESGEDLTHGILREITEESGLHEFGHVEKILRAQTHFYNSRKKLNRAGPATCLLVILKSTGLVATKREAHEKDFTLSWMRPEEILANWQEHNQDKSLDHWIMFLQQAVGRAIELGYDTTTQGAEFRTSAYTGEGVLINSGDWDGLYVPQQKAEVIADLDKKGVGQGYTNYHVRDWLISRQRYWGPPIPMIYCEACAKNGKSWFDTPAATMHKLLFKHFPRTQDQVAGWYPEENLPVALPYIEDYKPLGTGNSPLGNHPEFYTTTCPECGKEAKRETDVSDTFLDSAWYFYRYISPQDASAAWNHQLGEKWLPPTIYTGGAEHSVLHLLYARFLTKVFKDLGLIEKFDEPFPQFFAHGLIIKDGAKMSKSKGNVVVPDEYIHKFGADTLRTYLMFLGPFNMGGDFRDSGIEGMSRFLKRVWALGQRHIVVGKELSTSAKSEMHKTIKAVTEDIESFKYNTAIAKIMTYYNFLSQQSEVSAQEVKVLLQLLAPFAPHMTEELYQQIQNSESRIQNDSFASIHTSKWPEFDPEAIQAGQTVIAVQINGKLRATFELNDPQVSQEEVERIAHEGLAVQRHLQDKTVRKVIYVPGKILNFVVG